MDRVVGGSSRGAVWTEGLIAGLLGYAAVVLFFLLFDIIAGRGAFFTPALLGWSFMGDPAAGPIVAPGPVLAYNGVHLLLFLAVGAVVAWLVHETERHPGFWYVSFFAALGSVFLGVLLLLIATSSLRADLAAGAVVLATALAGVVIGAYLWRAHPGLSERIDSAEHPGASA